MVRALNVRNFRESCHSAKINIEQYGIQNLEIERSSMEKKSILCDDGLMDLYIFNDSNVLAKMIVEEDEEELQRQHDERRKTRNRIVSLEMHWDEEKIEKRRKAIMVDYLEMKLQNSEREKWRTCIKQKKTSWMLNGPTYLMMKARQRQKT